MAITNNSKYKLVYTEKEKNHSSLSTYKTDPYLIIGKASGAVAGYMYAGGNEIFDANEYTTKLYIHSNYFSTLPAGYTASNLSNQDLQPTAGDSIITAISKIHKVLIDDEVTISTSLNELNQRVTNTDNALISHSHSGYISITDLNNHSHANYASDTHAHSGYSPTTHGHAGYALTSHGHSGYALTSHGHSGYATISHSHANYGPSTLSSNYVPSILTNEDLEPDPGDTIETAIGKLHKALLDDENISAEALNYLDQRITENEEVIAAALTDLDIRVDTPVVVSSSSTIELQPNKFYSFGTMSSLTISFATPVEGRVNNYMFEFDSGTSATTLSVPNTVIWQKTLSISASKHYEVNLRYSQSKAKYYGIVVEY